MNPIYGCDHFDVHGRDRGAVVQSRAMSHKTITEHMQMADISKVMEEISGMMPEMSQKMAQGSMSPSDSKQMQERIRSMHKRMKELQKSAK